MIAPPRHPGKSLRDGFGRQNRAEAADFPITASLRGS